MLKSDMTNFKTTILKITLFHFLSSVSGNSSNSVVITPSPSTVNETAYSTMSTVQANAASQPTGNMTSTVGINETYVASQHAASPGGQSGQGQGQGQFGGNPGSGQSGSLSPSPTTTTIVPGETASSGGQPGQLSGSGQSVSMGAEASQSPSSTSSVVLQQTASPGGQSSSGGQSSGGQSSGGQSSSGGHSSGGQSSGGQSSSSDQLLQYLNNLSPEQKNFVKTFDNKRKEIMNKLELKSQVQPMTTEKADVDFLKTFDSLLEESQTFGQEFDTKFNAKINYAIYNSTSTVLQTKKIDCVSQRVNNFPEKVDPKSTAATANLISLPLKCPIRIKKAPVTRRRRRDVDYSVELKWDHHSSEDPVQYAHMYRYLRARREAAAQQNNSSCSNSPCLDTRLNMTIKITSMNYTADLDNKDSQKYKDLTDSVKNLLNENITSTNSEWKIKIHGFELSSGSIGVSFFVDCPLSAWMDIRDQLQLIAGAASFGSYVIDTSFSLVQKVLVVHGSWSAWSLNPWPTPLPREASQCGDNFQVKRTRTCTNPIPLNGGKPCQGPSTEYKNCTCGGTFKDDGGTINSPYWPNNYPLNAECVWILKVPFNHSVMLQIKQFNLESDKKCFYDYVQIFDGNDTNARELLPRTCGTKGLNRTLKSSDTTMMVRFRSDKSVTYKGFTATWNKVVQPWKPPKPIEYEEQNVTVTSLISCPTYNDSTVPLGKATTCPDKSYGDDCYFEKPAYLISCVVGVQMNRRDLPLEGPSRINTTFKHIMHKDLFPDFYTREKFCVTWNASLSKSLTGAWTRQGCSIFSKNFTHTTCQCDHTGIFGLLVSEKVIHKKLILLANTYSATGVSFFLILVAIFHIAWKVDIHGGEVMRMNICAAIIILMMTFLIGANIEAEKTLCGFLTFLLLFSIFAKFLWLMLHGLRIHGKIKEVFASGFNIEIVYVLFGWGLPLVMSLIAVGIQVNIKKEKDVCWTAVAGGSMWGYTCPLLVILLLNISVLIAVVVPTEERKTKYDYNEMKYRVLKDAVLLTLFGVTCMTAYFTVAQETFTAQYFLSISVVLQSVAMIIFGREGRKDFVKRKEKKSDNADTLSQNTNEEDFPEKFDEDSVSDQSSSKKSGKEIHLPEKGPRVKNQQIRLPERSQRVKNLKNGKEQEPEIDA